MRNKAQSAMEYLMTYGWAILIVIVVVAALYSMGVFSGGGGGVPCSPCFSYFAYVDHNATDLIMTSGAQEIQITSITDDDGVLLVGYTNPVSPGTRLRLYNSTAGTTPGYIFDNGDIITINYIRTTSGMTGTDTGTLHS